jgi:DNA-binding ferritin-like protein
MLVGNIMESFSELCTFFIAFLRAISIVERNGHWITRGNYADHLLLDRVYESANKDEDAVAERLVGLYGVEVLDLNTQAEMLNHILKQFSDEEVLTVSLAIEQKFLTLCDHFLETAEREDKLTTGLSNLVEEIASHREESVYLLKQALSNGEKMNSKMAARRKNLLLIKKAQISNDEAERKGFADLKIAISSSLTKMVARDKKGSGATFGIRANRGGGQTTSYNIQVVVVKGSPEEKFTQMLEQELPGIVKQVPYFTNKQVQTSVAVVDSLG